MARNDKRDRAALGIFWQWSNARIHQAIDKSTKKFRPFITVFDLRMHTGLGERTIRKAIAECHVKEAYESQKGLTVSEAQRVMEWLYARGTGRRCARPRGDTANKRVRALAWP